MILVGYNNCGPVSHGEKTSTQAINPGDFGDGEPIEGVGSDHHMYFTSLLTSLCRKLPLFDNTIEFDECYQVVQNSMPLAHTIYKDSYIENISSIVSYLFEGSLVRYRIRSESCSRYIANINSENENIEALKTHIKFYLELNNIINPKIPDLATAVILYDSNCTTMISRSTP